jgi:hypothetical protein
LRLLGQSLKEPSPSTRFAAIHENLFERNSIEPLACIFDDDRFGLLVDHRNGNLLHHFIDRIGVLQSSPQNGAEPPLVFRQGGRGAKRFASGQVHARLR